MDQKHIIAAVAGVICGSVAASVYLTTRSRKNSEKLMVKERSTTNSGTSVYESNKAVDEYLQFHYATADEIFPYAFGTNGTNFPVRCALFCSDALGTISSTIPPPWRALDVGCAVGGSTFELARAFDEVIGIDFSKKFVDAACYLKGNGSMPYTRVEEGKITSKCLATVPSDIRRERVRFIQADACALPESLGQFDCVMGANLLCRLPNPYVFLERCRSLVKPGGILVLISPFSWLEEYTPLGRWLGGYVDSTGTPRFTEDTLLKILSTDFDLVQEEDIPFLIREHARKYQYGVSRGQVWKRKATYPKMSTTTTM